MVLHTAIQDHCLVAQLKFDRHTKYFVRFAQSPQQNEGDRERPARLKAGRFC
jgi:hypothetical protein